jgi:hypothetical protein
MHVSIVQFSLVFPSCLLPTAERRQGASVTFGGLSGVLRPLADASESANQWDLEIETECGVKPLINLVCNAITWHFWTYMYLHNSEMQLHGPGCLNSNFD